MNASAALLRALLSQAHACGGLPRDLRYRIAEALRVPTARRQPLPSDYEDPYFATKEIDRCE